MLSSKEVAKSSRTLICLLQSLVSRPVQIELRNDTYVLGTLKSVDACMNIELSNAYIWSIYALLDIDNCSNKEIVINTDHLPDPEWLAKQPIAEYLFIKGSRIRYFHLPNEVDIIDCIEQKVNYYANRRNNSMINRPFNWKTYRKNQKFMKLQGKELNQSESQQVMDNEKQN